MKIPISMSNQKLSSLNKRFIFNLGFLFLLIIALFFSCEKRVEKESIKIGIVLPFSGELSTYGNECLDGIILKLDEVNQQNGIRGKKLDYISQDNQGDPLKTAQEVDFLSKDKSILVIIGAGNSTNTLAGASVAQHKKIPLLNPLATNPMITEVGDFISRICFIDPLQGSALANFAYSYLKLKKNFCFY